MFLPEIKFLKQVTSIYNVIIILPFTVHTHRHTYMYICSHICRNLFIYTYTHTSWGKGIRRSAAGPEVPTELGSTLAIQAARQKKQDNYPAITQQLPYIAYIARGRLLQYSHSKIYVENNVLKIKPDPFFWPLGFFKFSNLTCRSFYQLFVLLTYERKRNWCNKFTLLTGLLLHYSFMGSST